MGDLGIAQISIDRHLERWNPRHPSAVEENSCMHHLVEIKCQEIPNAEAICSWDGLLSYADLSSLSSIIAKRLVYLGVRPGVHVPFAYEKTLWAAVVMLAILKAGGSFVPLNPSDPKPRLVEILSTVNACLLVTTERLAARFTSLVSHVEIIDYSTISIGAPQKPNYIADRISDSYDQYTLTNVRPLDPIFVLFTSGSTGQPEGMVLQHKAICTHAITHGKLMGYEGARVLQFAAYTFDVAVMDIFTTLIYGGCICIPSEEDRRSNITGVIDSMCVDFAILTPSFAGLIEPSDVPTIKTLAIGGEALPQDRIEKWSGRVNLIQIYGPAEAGIIITTRMQPDTSPETIGYPLQSCNCFLVDPDDSDQLVPIGAVGELVVAGPTLALGYLNNEAKTQASFVSPPKWAKALNLGFDRFYRTGDLLRYNVDMFDGSLDFIGRKDHQFKLRGQRVEPGEIEHHLGKLPRVALSIVIRPDKGCYAGDLVAILQMHDLHQEELKSHESSIELADHYAIPSNVVQKHVSQFVPSYMVPQVVLVVKNMPFLPSLKIDRKGLQRWLETLEINPLARLADPLSVLLSHEKTSLMLSREIDHILAQNDNTRRNLLEGRDFRLQETGIDSIQIISLLMVLRRSYNKRVPVELLMTSSITVRELARFIDDAPMNNGHVLREEKRNVQAPTHFPTALVDLDHEWKSLASRLGQSTAPTKEVTRKTRDSFPGHRATCNVLLTGVTGFLGSSILHQLLLVPHIHVFVVVRCSSVSEGIARIRKNATLKGRWHDDFESRIHIWPGDLSQRNLGLSPEHLNILEGKLTSSRPCIHAVIHNGAKVHYSCDYEALKSVNVESTIDLLRIIADSPSASNFIFVSGGMKPDLVVSSAEQLTGAGGYAQTKYVSEQIIQHCALQPAYQEKKLRIVKPGYIIGSSGDGIASKSDFIWRLIAGCVEIGAYNQDEAEHHVFLDDVESVAKRVVDKIFRPVGVGHKNGDKSIDWADWIDGTGKLHRDYRLNTEDTSGGTDENDEDDGEIADQKHGKTQQIHLKYATPQPVPIVRILTSLTFSTIFRLLSTTFSYPRLTPLPGPEWLSRLTTQILEIGQSHLLFPLLHILERDGLCIGNVVDLGVQRADWVNLDRGGRGYGGEDEDEDEDKDEDEDEGVGKGRRVEEAVEANVRWLIGVGFLPVPPGGLGVVGEI